MAGYPGTFGAGQSRSPRCFPGKPLAVHDHVYHVAQADNVPDQNMPDDLRRARPAYP